MSVLLNLIYTKEKRRTKKECCVTNLLVFFPGSAAGAAALKSGRRPRGRSPCPRRRPSVVTEGYIRLAAPAADHLVLTSARFRFTLRSTIIRCNLQCILRVVFKKHRFLQGFVAFAVSRFHLGDVKKPWVFQGFGS